MGNKYCVPNFFRQPYLRKIRIYVRSLATMKALTLDESIFLAAILILEEGAYGVAIRRQALAMAGKSVSYGTLYSHLDQLFRKGYVAKSFGKPSPARGGRSKIYYQVTRAGLDALRSSLIVQRSLQKSLLDAVPGLVAEKG
jgi:PadR family transcriptional regulator PadR